ncbi:hypothetical protein C8R44DRAFT_745851 [Mycena epipterygia]|nr:hypothetical protein C8R44DRAFT_745851 [Mycena epipterygia]
MQIRIRMITHQSKSTNQILEYRPPWDQGIYTPRIPQNQYPRSRWYPESNELPAGEAIIPQNPRCQMTGMACIVGARHQRSTPRPTSNIRGEGRSCVNIRKRGIEGWRQKNHVVECDLQGSKGSERRKGISGTGCFKKHISILGGDRWVTYSTPYKRQFEMLQARVEIRFQQVAHSAGLLYPDVSTER